MEEKYSADIVNSCDGWACSIIEERLCLRCRFHWWVSFFIVHLSLMFL